MKLRTKIIALLCACFLLLNIVDMVIPRTEAQVYENTVRLHILANDNGEIAQGIKLKVRDRILAEYGSLFDENGNIEAASETIISMLSDIEATANRVLDENLAGYKARVLWGIEEYPTRAYEGFTLPAGRYCSLRIVLGSGEGNNWWCVLFPPLCTKASGDEGITVSGVKGKDSEVFTKKKYTFRFKLLEIFGG